jgi:hypothetical protein
MMERRQYNNPWAEKLSQVSLPDGGEAWVAMEALLDKEMPVDWKRDRRRWLLLILLLLLLIGVCNCPGRGRFSAAKTGLPPSVRVGSFRAVRQGGTAASWPSPAENVAPPAPAAGGAAHAQPPVAGSNTYAQPPAAATGRHSKSGHHQPKGDDPEGNASEGATPNGESSHFANSPHATPNNNAPKAGARQPEAEQPEAEQPGAEQPGAEQPGAEQPPSPKKNDSLSVPARKPVSKDSTHKKPVAPPKEDQQKERQGGWMVGIGLNQFFTVGGQQASSFNSGGITGTLSDYIPIPMVRYYFNHKLYVQLEVQINTPQYTKKNVVISAPPPDSIRNAITTTTIQTSANIQKLFYFNVPLSVHYEPFDNVNLGAGLQFSRLSNAIGSFDSTISTQGSPDTVNLKATHSFKGDPLYQRIKTNEFRFLVDASYTYRHFIIGLRYNQALSKFIDIQVAPGQITQSRNSSLQLYLRYILWDGRKKKPLVPAK